MEAFTKLIGEVGPSDLWTVPDGVSVGFCLLQLEDPWGTLVSTTAFLNYSNERHPFYADSLENTGCAWEQLGAVAEVRTLRRALDCAPAPTGAVCTGRRQRSSGDECKSSRRATGSWGSMRSRGPRGGAPGRWAKTSGLLLAPAGGEFLDPVSVEGDPLGTGNGVRASGADPGWTNGLILLEPVPFLRGDDGPPSFPVLVPQEPSSTTIWASSNSRARAPRMRLPGRDASSTRSGTKTPSALHFGHARSLGRRGALQPEQRKGEGTGLRIFRLSWGMVVSSRPTRLPRLESVGRVT